MSKTKAEQLAAVRATRAKKKEMAKARGLCITCVKVQPPPGQLNCDGCRAGFRADAAKRSSKARANGSCVKCKKAPACLPCPYCCQCSDMLRTYNRERYRAIAAKKKNETAQKTCKVQKSSGIINESVTHKHGDTNHGKSKEVRSQRVESNQGHQSQARCQGEGRTEGQSNRKGRTAPQVLGLPEIQHRPQRAHLPRITTIAVFAVTFGLLVAGMLR